MTKENKSSKNSTLKWIGAYTLPFVFYGIVGSIFLFLVDLVLPRFIYPEPGEPTWIIVVSTLITMYLEYNFSTYSVMIAPTMAPRSKFKTFMIICIIWVLYMTTSTIMAFTMDREYPWMYVFVALAHVFGLFRASLKDDLFDEKEEQL